MKKITFSTSKDMEIVQLTSKIKKEIKGIDVGESLIHVYAPHATGAIIINESADSKVQEDIINKLKDLFPKGAGYKHDLVDGNAHSHLMSTFLGCSETIPIENGEMQLGTWQDVSFVETDGPRSKRNVYIQVIEK